MYGFGLSTSATKYQGEIAAAASKWAAPVLLYELNKTTTLRIWHHEVLEALALADYDRGCALVP
jgi:hypothetical protein